MLILFFHPIWVIQKYVVTGLYMNSYLFLFISIVCEVIATTALKLSDSFTRLWPATVTVLFYLLAFWSLTIPMRTIPTGIIYAIWSGAGIVLISLVGWVVYGQKLDMAALAGMGLIIAGVVVINLFSNSSGHWKALSRLVLCHTVQIMIKNFLVIFVVLLFLLLSLEVFFIEKRHVNYFRDGVRNVEEVLSLWEEH